jgi:biotin transporter BioY
MYIVAIGWLWVVLMMAVTETSVTAGILTFFFYGLAPLALFLWLVGTPARRRRRSAVMADEEVRQQDGGDTGRNE